MRKLESKVNTVKLHERYGKDYFVVEICERRSGAWRRVLNDDGTVRLFTSSRKADQVADTLMKPGIFSVRTRRARLICYDQFSYGSLRNTRKEEVA